jgi:hypothetical protein
MALGIGHEALIAGRIELGECIVAKQPLLKAHEAAVLVEVALPKAPKREALARIHGCLGIENEHGIRPAWLTRAWNGGLNARLRHKVRSEGNGQYARSAVYLAHGLVLHSG